MSDNVSCYVNPETSPGGRNGLAAALRGRFALVLTLLCLAALVVRVGYVAAQPATDPNFARPALDAAFYLDWARSLATGEGAPSGAFYLAPLYPHALWLFLELFGESFTLLYLIQHLLSVATGGLLALVGRRLIDDASGLAACALFLLYPPTLFFSSRPMGEPLALLLLTAGLYCLGRRSPGASGLAGLTTGIAALARPNLILVLVVWAIGLAWARQRRETVWLVVGALVVLLPVTARNWVVSGHPVLVSSNAGITFYHGNGPGARGIVTLPAGFSGELSTQRLEATRLASLRTGETLDPVQADRWWGQQAVRTRLDDPVDTLRLLLARLCLLAADAEIALDNAPRLDANPWRWAAPLPFALLLGLAMAGVYLRGFRNTGGPVVWFTIAACAVMPLVFYVSSRYRFPMAALLCLPAGAGLIGLVRRGSRRWMAWTLLLLVAAVSLQMPVARQIAVSDAAALANRATSWKRAGHPDRAEADLRLALERDADSVPALFGLGVVLAQTGRLVEAETSYRAALARNPASAEAAGNLARLMIRNGRAAEAVPILRGALAHRPYHRICWTWLVAALHATGEREQAEAAAREAAARGVEIVPP